MASSTQGGVTEPLCNKWVLQLGAVHAAGWTPLGTLPTSQVH